MHAETDWREPSAVVSCGLLVLDALELLAVACWADIEFFKLEASLRSCTSTSTLCLRHLIFPLMTHTSFRVYFAIWQMFKGAISIASEAPLSRSAFVCAQPNAALGARTELISHTLANELLCRTIIMS